jgi:hypothetical protein
VIIVLFKALQRAWQELAAQRLGTIVPDSLEIFFPKIGNPD